MQLTILVCTLITAAAAILTLFPLFGVHLRTRRRSAELSTLPAGGKDSPKAWLALGLAASSVCLSSFAAYHFFRPRIVERPVEKIVEKMVQQECPKCQPTTSGSRKQQHKDSPAAGVPSTTINAPGGIPITGGNVTNPTVNNFAPPARELTSDDSGILVASLSRTKATVRIGAMVDKEAFHFAGQLYGAFKTAGWTVIEDRVRGLVPGPDQPPGVRVGFHGEPPKGADNTTIEVADDSLQWRVIAALEKAHVKELYVSPRPEIPEGTIEIAVWANPDSR